MNYFPETKNKIWKNKLKWFYIKSKCALERIYKDEEEMVQEMNEQRKMMHSSAHYRICSVYFFMSYNFFWRFSTQFKIHSVLCFMLK